MVNGVLVDTNVIVSYLLDRSPEQRRRAAELIEAAENPDRRLLLHQLVLAETAFVLLRLYGQRAAQISETLGKLLAIPGAEPVAELSWENTLELWPATTPHFLDAVLIAAAHQLRPDAVATFDQGLNRRLKALGVPTYW